MDTISLIINKNKDTRLTVACSILRLLSSYPVRVQVSRWFQRTLSDSKYRVVFCDDEQLYNQADLMIVLGGDGSIMKSAGRCRGHEIPVLGVNMGRVGYLAEIDPDEVDKLHGLFNGSYLIEKHMMICAQVRRSNAVIRRMPPAVNDCVVSNGTVSHMVNIELRCDGNFISNYHSDGLIVATPTGSTAYSLSAGGPVVDPKMNCMCITPVCSHSLMTRPMVVAPGSVIEIKNVSQRENNTYLTVDGTQNFKLIYGDVVRITRSEQVMKMVRFQEHGFYSVLNRKFAEQNP